MGAENTDFLFLQPVHRLLQVFLPAERNAEDRSHGGADHLWLIQIRSSGADDDPRHSGSLCRPNHGSYISGILQILQNQYQRGVSACAQQVVPGPFRYLCNSKDSLRRFGVTDSAEQIFFQNIITDPVQNVRMFPVKGLGNIDMLPKHWGNLPKQTGSLRDKETFFPADFCFGIQRPYFFYLYIGCRCNHFHKYSRIFCGCAMPFRRNCLLNSNDLQRFRKPGISSVPPQPPTESPPTAKPPANRHRHCSPCSLLAGGTYTVLILLLPGTTDRMFPAGLCHSCSVSHHIIVGQRFGQLHFVFGQ